ncbi:hypothetical protein [Nonomuraea sp. NPDC005650]|uniref:hypothetical protein n=1 Tax=Nonomuraea sp. NPDC005650 TaxID=3157045 RepID=UPI0033BA74B6
MVGVAAVRNAFALCGDCGQDVVRAHLFDRCGGIRILLDPTPVVGGDYTYWNPIYSRNPTYSGQPWRATSRPVKVPVPLGMSEEDAKQWDGKGAADGRGWFVQHVCGLTAEQVVDERRRRKSA